MHYHPARNALLDYVRRRRWSRKCKIRTLGLWIEVPQSHRITSFTFSIDENVELPSKEHLVIWATEKDGNLLCSVINKAYPTSIKWRNLSDNILKFKNVTVGTNLTLFAVDFDGRVHIRLRVNASNNFCGTSWSLLETQQKVKMKHISAGHMTLWAVSDDNVLYFRKDITSTFPEGTEWLHVSDKIEYVCVNSKNQVGFR